MKTLEPSRPPNPSLPSRLHASMPPLFSSRQRKIFLLLLIAALILRLIGMAFIPLIPEEAYYWMYARHPSLSYFDHPAMVAWIIQLGTALFGNTEFGVRIVNDLLMLGASGLMYALARQWWGRRPALFAALSLQILPVYFGIGFTGMMDGALVFWWLLCLLGISLAVRKNARSAWYLAGIGFGLALQSKYSAIFLAPGALLLLLAYPPYRKHLKSPHAWLGLLLGLALFAPTLLWNAQHDWASFRFQFLSRSNRDPVNAGTIAAFLAFQFAILTPLPFIAAALLLKRLLKKMGVHRFPCKGSDANPRNPRRRFVAPSLPRFSPHWVFAFSFCLPLVAALAFKSLREAHLNWTVPAWLSLLPALAHLLDARLRLRAMRGVADPAAASTRPSTLFFDWRPGLRLTAWICLSINAALILYLLLLQPRLGGIPAFGPWKPLAHAVQKQVDQMEAKTGRPVLLIAEDKYRLASILAFYRLPLDPRATQNTTSQWIIEGSGLGYPYWLNRPQWTGRDALYISDHPHAQQQLIPRFDRVEPLPPLRLPHHPTFHLTQCFGLHP